jgi:hypothetical protein
VIRGLPWILLIVVLLAIFVFTAYAVTGNPATTQPGSGGGGCVTVADGPTVQSASCGTPGARAVVAQVGLTQACPDQSERLQPATGPIAYCLEVGK